MHFQSFYLHDQIKRRYVVRVWTPNTLAPQDGYPLLIMLDGDWLTDIINEQQLANPGLPFAIASLGFNLDKPLARQRRTFEYTPIPPEPYLAVDPRRPTWKVGGALQLQDFIQHTLLQKLAQSIALNPKKMGIYGHSYGGLFVLYSLLSQPGFFKHYISASPSLWWYRPFMQKLASTLKTDTAPAVRLDLLIGDAEQWRPLAAMPNAPRPDGIPTIQFLHEFSQNLPPLPWLRTELHRFAHADHGAMLPLSAQFALHAFHAGL